jgi:hypothetical protein
MSPLVPASPLVAGLSVFFLDKPVRNLKFIYLIIFAVYTRRNKEERRRRPPDPRDLQVINIDVFSNNFSNILLLIPGIRLQSYEFTQRIGRTRHQVYQNCEPKIHLYT